MRIPQHSEFRLLIQDLVLTHEKSVAVNPPCIACSIIGDRVGCSLKDKQCIYGKTGKKENL